MGKTVFNLVGLAVAAVFVPYAAPIFIKGLADAAFAGNGGAPPPDTASTSIKTSRPERVSAYGSRRLWGAYALYETSDAGRAIDVYPVHDGKMDGHIQIYLNDDAVTVDSLTGGALSGGNVQSLGDGRYGGNFIQFYLTDGRAVGTPISNVVAQLPGIWTDDHRGDGVVVMALICSPVKSEDFLDVYPNSVPLPSVAARWQLCPDPFSDDPTDETQWTWTENVIRQLMHYKMVREKVDYVTKILPTLAYWRAAAAVCDEPVPLKSGGAEARWRSAVTHKHTDKHGAVTDNILAACDGWIAPRADGALVVYAGKFTTPTVAIGASEIVAYDWSYGVDDDQAVNEYICAYISPEHDYNTVECDAWRDESDITQRGQILSDGLDPQVPSWGQVRRLAKRRMARVNAPFRGTVTTNIAGRIARGHRYIWLTLTEAGTTFYDGPVEVTSLRRNIGTGGVTFAWTAASAAIDAWNPATEEGEPAANGERVAPQPLETPTINAASPQIYDYGAQISLDVDGPDRSDLTWYTRWRLSGDVAWTEQTTSDVDPGTPVALMTPIVPVNVSIDVQVAYGVGDGRNSDWSTTATVSTDASGLAPGPVTEVSVVGSAAQATIQWRDPTSSNYSATRLFHATVNSFGSATQVNGDMLGALGQQQVYDDPRAAGVHYYWLVTLNASGGAGSPVATGGVTVT